MPAMIQSSAAPAVLAPARAERPTAAPKARALAHAFIASSLCPRPKANAMAAIVGTEPIRSCGREPVVSTPRQEPVTFPRLWCATLAARSAPVLRLGCYIEFQFNQQSSETHDNAAALRRHRSRHYQLDRRGV